MAGLLVTIPVSVGELVDKVTILRIKRERIAEAKRPHVDRELAFLEEVLTRAVPRVAGLGALTRELHGVNARLWEIEEGKRNSERRGDFGPAFVALARAVYLDNDRRAALKREINALTGSEIVEEKSYSDGPSAGPALEPSNDKAAASTASTSRSSMS